MRVGLYALDDVPAQTIAVEQIPHGASGDVRILSHPGVLEPEVGKEEGGQRNDCLPVVEVFREPNREVFRQLEAPSLSNIGNTARFGHAEMAEGSRTGCSMTLATGY